jgi:hypothetical protein
MMNKILGLVLVTLSLCYNINAQNGTIRGRVVDSSLNLPLRNASIVLLQGRDSFIVKSQRADKDGAFDFRHLPDTGAYILFFSYPKYASYSHRINLRDAKNGVIDMNMISLIQKGKLLHEVIVKSQVAAIKINGDTTEYKADSFKVQPNATVEELLR